MRTAGVLLPVFSLPGRYGIGGFSKEARAFVDFLSDAHQSCWQILPMGPTGYGDSPYQTFSTFAGNPYFISLESLIDEGLLTARECMGADRRVDPHYIDYGRLYKERFNLLKKAFARFDTTSGDFAAFCAENEEWLYEYAFFMALKNEFDGVAFTRWEEPLRKRDSRTLEKYRKKLEEEILFQEFMQFKFHTQWRALKAYANEKGVEIIGDIPIYVSPDSSDIWSHPELFRLDEKGQLSAVAGCPPDGFTPDGQLWGNPLYDWEYHEKTGFEWWIRRMKQCSELYDVVRIDHFRGFDSYYAIPFGDVNARGGRWEKGPGYALFAALKKALGNTSVIAEDLGFITASVRRLVKRTGYPNMKVLEFAFDTSDEKWRNEYLPHNFGENCVIYTGTHDNETLAGWLSSCGPAVRRRVKDYADLRTRDVSALCERLVRLCMASAATRCIIPLQDHLALGNEARINTPSTLGGNWVWRCGASDLTSGLAHRIADLTDMYGRGI